MAKSENQRIKLLRLYEYLKTHSDEKNPVSVNEIIEALEIQGIKCERRTIYHDIKLLKEFGYDIQTKGYKHYLADNELNLGQIRFLIDVAQSAYFLPVKQTEDICGSLERLAGSHHSELVHEQVICFDRVKRTNEEVLDTVEKINRAIENDFKVSFRYFHIVFGGKREYGKNGEYYVQNPIGLVFHDGRYYFIAYNDKHDGITTFRIDRMSDVKIETKMPKIHSDKEAQFFCSDLKDRMSAFGMWNDAVERVTFLVEKKYAEDIYEKFGDKISTYSYDQEHFTFTEKVNLSDSFFGWCASYGTHIKIISPQSTVDKFIEKMNEALSIYSKKN